MKCADCVWLDIKMFDPDRVEAIVECPSHDKDKIDVIELYQECDCDKYKDEKCD